MTNTNKDNDNGTFDESQLTTADKRLVKCPYCEDRLPRYQSIQHTNKRYYHKECYESYQGEANWYQELIAYICQDLYKIDKPTGLILQQIKRYSEPPFNYKYKGIELTLRYFFETLGNLPREGDGIGIVVYYYDKVEQHYINKKRIKTTADNFNFDSYDDVNEVTISPPTVKREARTKKIDMDSI